MNPAQRFPRSAFLLLMAACTAGCGSGNGTGGTPAAPPPAPHDAHVLEIPEGFPRPVVPDDNPLTAAKIELGRHLFYDRRMSINGARSCGDCHEQRRAFSDGRARAVGITSDQVHPRNAMSLTNVVYNAVFNWANPNLTTLERQAEAVLFNERPVELGWVDHEEEILDRFRHDPFYLDLFQRAFPGDPDPFTTHRVIQALASFQRILISGDSPFDRYRRGHVTALSESAQRGMALFFSERLECFHCHGGFNFSQSVNHAGVVFHQAEFHNTGLYNIDGQGGFPADNRGLWEFTHVDSDMGRFRAPTLRNIALTAPYMHDGSMQSLESVLMDHYARGGRLIESGPYAGDGAKNPYKSSLITGFVLTEQETRDVLAFLESLTDWSFICDPRLRDPFGNIPDHERCQ